MDYFYYHWGPFLLRTQISAKECQLLLQEGKKCRKKSNDYRHELAGHMKEEYQIKNIEGMLEWFQKYIDGYVEASATVLDTLDLISKEVEVAMATTGIVTSGGADLVENHFLESTDIEIIDTEPRPLGVVSMSYYVQYRTSFSAPDVVV